MEKRERGHGSREAAQPEDKLPFDRPVCPCIQPANRDIPGDGGQGSFPPGQRCHGQAMTEAAGC